MRSVIHIGALAPQAQEALRRELLHGTPGKVIFWETLVADSPVAIAFIFRLGEEQQGNEAYERALAEKPETNRVHTTRLTVEGCTVQLGTCPAGITSETWSQFARDILDRLTTDPEQD